MKKLIAVFLSFILISATAFAQVSLDKRLVIGTSFANSNTLQEEGGQTGIEASVQRTEYSLSIGGMNADGTFGFGGEFEKRHLLGRLFGFAWWSPVPEFMIALGEVTNWQVPLGRASGDISGWGLFGTDAYHMDDDSFWEGGGYAGSILKTRHGFYQGGDYTTVGWQSAFSGAIAIRPLTWFDISSPNKLNLLLFFPTLAGDSTGGYSDNIKTVYWDRIEFQISYEIHEVGQVAFSFRNSMREAGMAVDVPNTDGTVYTTNNDAVHWYDDSKGIFAQWQMNLPYDMGFEVGLQYTIAPSNNNIKSKWPINAGLGWIMRNIRDDDFLTLSSRMGFQIPVEDFHNFIWGMDFVTNIRITENTRLYLPVGLGLIFPSNGPAGEFIMAGKGENTIVYWAFSPYIVHDLGGPKVHLCFRIHNGQGAGWPQLGPNAPHNGEVYGNRPSFLHRGEVITWSIPVYMAWSF